MSNSSEASQVEGIDLFDGLELDTASDGTNAETPTILTPIIDPQGEIVPRDDADALADCYERLKEWEAELSACKRDVKLALLALTEGTAKTRYVRGRRRRVKVEMPGRSFEQSILKEAWNSYPQFRDECLKIDVIGVKIREYGKIAKESGPPEFETFKSMVMAADREPTALPTVKIEE